MLAVKEIGATRVVIDSLSGFEIALAPGFREDFRESLYRLVGALTATGVTVFMTSEVVSGYPELNFTNDRVSFITDDVISQRYVELHGRLQKVMIVVKMRGSAHSHDFRTYELGPNGAVMGGRLADYRGIATGEPAFDPARSHARTGLTGRENRLLDLLVESGVMSHGDLVARSGMDGTDIGHALERLVTLGYAEIDSGSNGSFRAVAQ